MKSSRSSVLILGAWLFFAGGYVVVGLLLPPGSTQTALSYFLACLIPLFANTTLLWNAASPYRRRNAFWMFLALGCTLWLAGMLVITYTRLVIHQTSYSPFYVDLLFFLHTVPFMAALALAPHARKMRETLRFGLLDLVLLSILWLYVYIFAAMPWKTIWPDVALFNSRDVGSYMVENLVAMIGFGLLFFRAKGTWRRIYGHLFGATSLYLVGFVLTALVIRIPRFYSGSLVRLPAFAAFVWFGITGIVAHDLAFEPEPVPTPTRRDTQWPARLAMFSSATLLRRW